MCIYIKKIYILLGYIFISMSCPRCISGTGKGCSDKTALPPLPGKAENSHQKAPSSPGKAAGAGSRCWYCSRAGGTGSWSHSPPSWGPLGCHRVPDAGCMRMSLTWLGDVPAWPSLEPSATGKQPGTIISTFWG